MLLTLVFAYRSTLLERRPPNRHRYIIARGDHEVGGHDDRKLELNTKLVSKRQDLFGDDIGVVMYGQAREVLRQQINNLL